MHKLMREIRFSVNPFLARQHEGRNSYASKPCGQGLAIFFSLWVEVTGPVNDETGFVINVVEIDKLVRAYAVPIFTEHIRARFGIAQHVPIGELYKILRQCWSILKGRFGQANVSKLSLQLNPYRKITIDSQDSPMVYFSEKFEFAAMHKLWNENFSDKENYDAFGKCANPAGHGHNYIVEVTVKRQVDEDEDFSISGFETTVAESFVDLVDHKNLNVDVPEFAKKVPTVENITLLAWDKLNGKFADAQLSKITVWETDKTFCSYSG